MLPGKDPPSESFIQDKEAEERGLSFAYRVGFEPRRSALYIQVVSEGKPVTRFEKYGIHVLSLQDRYPGDNTLNSSHRLFVQNLFRFGRFDSAGGYFVVPRKQVAFFLSRLSKFPDVATLSDGKAMLFSKQVLLPRFSLKSPDVRRLSLELKFFGEDGLPGTPFEGGVLFPGAKPWFWKEGRFYPLRVIAADELLKEVDPSGQLSLSGEKAVEFFESLLSQLVEEGEIGTPEGFKAPAVIRPTPEPVFSWSEDGGADRLLLTIQFSYEGRKLKPHQDESDVLWEVQEEDKRTLICRDISFEKKTLDRFLNAGFRRTGPDLFESGGSEALDFVSEPPPEGEEGDLFSNLKALQHFKVLGELSPKALQARVSPKGLDWFDLNLSLKVEDQEIPWETIQTLLQEGQRYLPVPGRGFLKLNREEFAKFQDTLSDLAEPTQGGGWKLSRFQAPYLDSLIQVDWGKEERFQNILKSLNENGELPAYPLPQDLAVLRTYQKHGYDWLFFLNAHRFHGILADDMGLGKTLQALAFLKRLKEERGGKPSLVLAPTSVVFNWAAEATKFTFDLKTLSLTGPERKENYDKIAEADLVLTSYAIFRRDAEKLCEREWRAVILDEAQYIKNTRSKTAGLVKGLKAEQRLALTGTPLENRLSELWSIFDFLMPGFLNHYSHFQRRYQKPIEEDRNVESLATLKRRLHPFILRRQKDEVAPELPPKTEIDQFCEMEEEQRVLYDQILLASRRKILQEVQEKGIDQSRFSILTALLRLRQVCCHPELVGGPDKGLKSGKLEMFQDLLDEIVSEGHRVIVFSQFVEMLTILRKHLDDEKIAYEYLDGRTRKREEHIRRFREDPAIPVFLISLKAGGTGLNLTEADYVIHYDPWWNPAVQDQATDRVHRLGQTQHVFSYKLITKDSVEEKIMALQGRKRDLFKGVLTADSAFGKKLSMEDLEFLFS